MEKQLMEFIRGEMREEPISERLLISDMLQNIIYFFNQPEIRNHVIHHYLKLLPEGEHVTWDETYYFNEKGMIDTHYHPDHEDVTLDDFIKNRPAYQIDTLKHKSKKTPQHYYVIFTCCILYEEHKVHFLSFIYNANKQVLVGFDPGIHLYHKGQDVLIPLLRKAFIKAGLISKKKDAMERIGLCKNKYFNQRYGIQYEGSDPSTTSLPADSFCQSWTLFFLIEFLRHGCSDEFVSTWCKIKPKFREAFVLLYYFLPWLQQDTFVSKKWLEFYHNGKDLTILLPYVIDSIQSSSK
jgi:hypothetical protein